MYSFINSGKLPRLDHLKIDSLTSWKSFSCRATGRSTQHGNPTRPRSFSVNLMMAGLNEVNEVVFHVVVAILDEISATEVKAWHLSE